MRKDRTLGGMQRSGVAPKRSSDRENSGRRLRRRSVGIWTSVCSCSSPLRVLAREVRLVWACGGAAKGGTVGRPSPSPRPRPRPGRPCVRPRGSAEDGDGEAGACTARSVLSLRYGRRPLRLRLGSRRVWARAGCSPGARCWPASLRRVHALLVREIVRGDGVECSQVQS